MNLNLPDLWQFGEFQLDTRRKVLKHRGETVAMPLKEIEVLSMLVRQRGELATKDELLSEIWGDSFVEESNLSRQIYLLRQRLKELGAGDLIETVPRRGYRFTGQLRELQSSEIVLEKRTQTRTLIEFEGSDLEHPISTRQRSRRFAIAAAVVVVASIAGLLGYRLARPVSSRSPIRSIVVLPFRSTTPTKETDHSGYGLADILTTRLSTIRELKVKSVATLADLEQKDATDVGKSLGVDAVLQGTIFRVGDRVRVTARLVNSADGSIAWTGSFEKLTKDEFRLQHDIASQIVPALAVILSSGERDAIAKKYTESPDAYELYLQGRYEWNKRNWADMIEAQRLFRNAIAADPDFALAYVGLADTILMTAGYEAESRATIDKALELDPTLAEAHASRGFYLMFYDWNWAESEAAFKRSIELNPNYATAHHWYSTLLAIRGDLDAAKSELGKALEINPNSHNFLADLGQLHYFAGDYQQAEAYCRKALELYPDFFFAHEYLHYIYLKTGRNEEAVMEIARADEINGRLGQNRNYPDGDLVARHRKIYLERGLDGYMEYRAPGTPTDPVTYYNYAIRYAIKGDNDKALDYLERSVGARMFLAAFAKANPMFDSLHSDHRYQELLRRMKLADL